MPTWLALFAAFFAATFIGLLVSLFSGAPWFPATLCSAIGIVVVFKLLYSLASVADAHVEKRRRKQALALAALHRARVAKWREEETPPSKWPPPLGDSRMTGIRHVVSKVGDKQYEYWQAADASGRRLAQFSIARYGRDKALQMAVKAKARGPSLTLPPSTSACAAPSDVDNDGSPSSYDEFLGNYGEMEILSVTRDGREWETLPEKLRITLSGLYTILGAWVYCQRSSYGPIRATVDEFLGGLHKDFPGWEFRFGQSGEVYPEVEASFPALFVRHPDWDRPAAYGTDPEALSLAVGRLEEIWGPKGEKASIGMN